MSDSCRYNSNAPHMILNKVSINLIVRDSALHLNRDVMPALASACGPMTLGIRLDILALWNPL